MVEASNPICKERFQYRLGIEFAFVATDTTPPAQVGRPRKFDPETERRLLMDTAIKVIAEQGYEDTSVGQILAGAGLSTRAFYRHFASKRELLAALLGRDSEAVQRSLERAVTEAPGPVAAIEAWLDCFFDVYYEPRRAARAALFSAAAVPAGYPLADITADMKRSFARPLAAAIRAGEEQHVLRSGSPEADAASIYALAAAAVDPRAGDSAFIDRAAADNHVKRYAWPALGLTN